LLRSQLQIETKKQLRQLQDIRNWLADNESQSTTVAVNNISIESESHNDCQSVTSTNTGTGTGTGTGQSDTETSDSQTATESRTDSKTQVSDSDSSSDSCESLANDSQSQSLSQSMWSPAMLAEAAKEYETWVENDVPPMAQDLEDRLIALERTTPEQAAAFIPGKCCKCHAIIDQEEIFESLSSLLGAASHILGLVDEPDTAATAQSDSDPNMQQA
jgi:hypothetical protein